VIQAVDFEASHYDGFVHGSILQSSHQASWWYIRMCPEKFVHINAVTHMLLAGADTCEMSPRCMEDEGLQKFIKWSIIDEVEYFRFDEFDYE
jgi:hypothetical protein